MSLGGNITALWMVTHFGGLFICRCTIALCCMLWPRRLAAKLNTSPLLRRILLFISMEVMRKTCCIVGIVGWDTVGMWLKWFGENEYRLCFSGNLVVAHPIQCSGNMSLRVSKSFYASFGNVTACFSKAEYFLLQKGLLLYSPHSQNFTMESLISHSNSAIF